MKNFCLFLALLFCITTHHTIVAQNQVLADIETNLSALLAEEDSDGDKKITIEDKPGKPPLGDRRFTLTTSDNKKMEIFGTYYLANLLQELSLQQKQGKTIAVLATQKIFADPVTRLSSQIREVFWDGLTRRIDASSLGQILTDSKSQSKDGYNYVYVPHQDETAYSYFCKVAQDNPALLLKVVRLPAPITREWVKKLDGFHGILTLKLTPENQGIPFVVPGGRFNEMYGWDSYFETLGLVEDGKIELAKGMVDQFVYQITHYGKILNANRTYYLTRSQPPFLTSMALAVYHRLPPTAENKEWLRIVTCAAMKEYQEVWMGEKRLTAIGLSRYHGEGIGQPMEVEPGHFNAVYQNFADKYNMSKEELEKRYQSGESSFPELDRYFTDDRSMRESGHDTTYRWDDRCTDFATVDLNCLLYKIETDIAWIIAYQFNNAFTSPDGQVQTSEIWQKRAEQRKILMNQYLWNEKDGVFYDFDLQANQQKEYMNAVVFYPLWAKLATLEQAARIVNKAIPALEQPGGLAASTLEARGLLSAARPPRQWDYPYGWAPHQMMAWQGLMNYGYEDIAHRLIYRWLYTITRNAADYNGMVPEKFDVVARSHQVFAEYGNVGADFSYITQEGFGWVNASYQVGLKYLPISLRTSLAQLIPPEWMFE